MSPLIDLVRRWPYTTAWIAYVIYVTFIFWFVGTFR